MAIATERAKTAPGQAGGQPSLVQQAALCWHPRAGAPEEEKPRRRKSGVCGQVNMDGYVRRSPVQQIQTAPGYRAACVKRALLAVAGALAAAAAFLLFLHFL